jgi:hypothetical protein
MEIGEQRPHTGEETKGSRHFYFHPFILSALEKYPALQGARIEQGQTNPG